MMSDRCQIEITTDYLAIKEAAEFFAREFWNAPDLTEQQRAWLAEQHQRDFDRRFGELTGKRRFPSCLLLARDGAQILGCAGVEMTVLDPMTSTFWDRVDAEANFASKFGAMGGRERSIHRKATLPELANIFLEGGQMVRPVLSNLAVSRQLRGTGLGARLVEACEEVARNAADAWAGEDIWLLVEATNAPALKLYTRLGFDEVWTQNDMATRLVPGAGGSLELAQEPVQLLAMAKKVVQ